MNAQLTNRGKSGILAKLLTQLVSKVSTGFNQRRVSKWHSMKLLYSTTLTSRSI